MTISTPFLFPDLPQMAPPHDSAPRRRARRQYRAPAGESWQIELAPLPAQQAPEPEAPVTSPGEVLEALPSLEAMVVTARASGPAADAPASLPRPKLLTGRLDATLADVMDVVTRDPSITTTQRSDWLCALRRLAKLLNKDPRLIPAAPDALRDAFQSIVPAAFGMTDRRLGTIRSRCLSGLRQAGIEVMRGRSSTMLSTAWQQLERALPDLQAKHALSRFMRFCTEHGITPEQVDDTVFDRFRATLQTQSLAKSPHALHRTAAHQWNRALRHHLGWALQRVTVPRNPRHYALDAADFPASFRAEVGAFLGGAGGGSDPFSDNYVRPQRPATIEQRRKQIWQMASLLVAAGVPIERMTGLAVLVEPAHAEMILKAAHKRLNPASSKGTVHLHGMAHLLKVMAKYWVKAELQDVEKLARLARLSAPPPRRGMTDKNRNRLRQFDSRENVLALLDLPERVFRELKAIQQPTRQDALRTLGALAVAILLSAPMRIANVAGLDQARHVIKVGRASNARVHIAIPGDETKTGEPFEVVLPREVVALLTTYQSRYRPLISDVASTLLFPNQAGGRRNTIAFARLIADDLGREIGLVMNVHLFRHLAAKLYLDAHPEDLETVRRILGHKSINTTIRYYAELKTMVAFARFDAVIQDLRARPLMRRQPRPTGTGGR